MISQFKKILHSDINRNIATIGFFNNYPIEEYYTENNSAIIYGKSDNYWAHLCCDNGKDLEKLLKKYHRITNFYYSVEDWMIPSILKFGETVWQMPTNRYILTDFDNIQKPKTDIVTLNNLHTDTIYNNSDYKKLISKAYIKDRLAKDVSSGILENNELVAWGFTHDDGALGFLHVLDDYRKNGYGSDIVNSLILKCKENNKPVFCNIVPENKKAISMVAKLGFEFDRKVSWLKIKNSSR